MAGIGWPRSPKGLAMQLKRQQPALPQLGIQLMFGMEYMRQRYYIQIKQVKCEDI